MSMAAAVTGPVSVPYVVLPILALIGRGVDWRAAALALLTFWLFGFGLLTSFALFTLAVIRPRSVPAAMGSALPVSLLLIWGTGLIPMSPLRLLLHLAAILCLAALMIRVIRGIAEHRFRVLWILPCLLLSLPIGYLAGRLVGVHIMTQYCQLPLIGVELSSFLCSG